MMQTTSPMADGGGSIDPRRLLDCVEDAILVLDEQLHVLFANAAVASFMGGEADTVSVDFDPLGAIHPDDIEGAFPQFLEAVGNRSGRTLIRLRVRDGDGWRPVEAVITNFLDDPTVRGLVVCFRNLAQEEQLRRSLDAQLELGKRNQALQAQLRERQHFLSRLVRIQSSISRRAPLIDVLNAVAEGAHNLLGDSLAIVRLVSDADPTLLELAACHGLRSEVAVQQPTIAAESGLGGTAFLSNEIVVLDDHQAFVEQNPVLATAGFVAGIAVPIRHGLEPVGCLTVCSVNAMRTYSQTEQEMLLALAEHASIALLDAHTVESVREALTDPLTGLPSRRLLIERLENSIDRCRANGGPLAVLFVDLDGFKAVNDSRGHAAGDALLIEIGKRLEASAREHDTVARFGGDEFIVVLEDADATAASAFASRMVDQIQQGVKVEGRSIFVGVTIGVDIAGPDDDRGAEAMVRRADIAMYRGKADERGGVVFFESTMEEAVVARAELESELRNAIRVGAIGVAFQPVVTMSTGVVHGVEALARWTSVVQGPIAPDRFIAIADRIGMVNELDRMVLRQACEAMPVIDAMSTGEPILLHVNLAAHHLDSADLVEGIVAVLESTGFPAQRLVVEITETAAMRDPLGVTDRLAQLKRLGVRVAIDDFGTGYSSLAYLERYPVDVLKIDRSFVAGLNAEPRSRHLTESMIQLAHSLGLTVVAEGIEETGQAEALQQLGTDFAQGYHFARPMDLQGLLEFLAERVPVASGVAQ